MIYPINCKVMQEEISKLLLLQLEGQATVVYVKLTIQPNKEEWLMCDSCDFCEKHLSAFSYWVRVCVNEC